MQGRRGRGHPHRRAPAHGLRRRHRASALAPRASAPSPEDPATLTALVHTSIALHAVATGFFLAYLLRFRAEIGALARRMLWVAVAVQAVAIVVGLTTPEGLGALRPALYLSAFAIDLVYLGLSLRFDLTFFGSFVVPISTAMLLAILFASAAAPPPDAHVVGVITYVHIGASMLGVLAFTASFLASVAYLARDFGLRTKKRNALLARLPSLSRLERMAHRSMLLGFPIYTVGLLLGTIWLTREGGLAGALQPQVLLSAGSWLVFALLLQMHAASGWRGARAAILNMVGYLLALLVVLIYALRSTVGG